MHKFLKILGSIIVVVSLGIAIIIAGEVVAIAIKGKGDFKFYMYEVSEVGAFILFAILGFLLWRKFNDD